MNKLATSVFCFLCLIIGVSAQDKVVEIYIPEPGSPEALKIAKPDIPKEVRKAGFWGFASVTVTVDANGRVTETGEASGPGWICDSATEPNVLAIRAAVKEAAKASLFKPHQVTPPANSVKATLTFDIQKNGVSVLPPFKVIPPRVYENDAVDVSVDFYLGSQKVSFGSDLGKDLLMPNYSKKAKEIGADGQVEVEVVLSKDGRVFSAKRVSGHILLGSYAQIAACGSAIPRQLVENRTTTTGKIVYDFKLKK